MVLTYYLVSIIVVVLEWTGMQQTLVQGDSLKYPELGFS